VLLCARSRMLVTMCVRSTPLVPGGADVLLYTTIGGAVGAFVPFISREVRLKGASAMVR
jgi:hypothetical protein